MLLAWYASKPIIGKKSVLTATAKTDPFIIRLNYFPAVNRGYYIDGIRYQDLKALKSSYYISRGANRIA